MLACTALVGCSEEDVVNNGNEVSKIDGDKAYVVVKLNNAEGTVSRGSSPTDNGGLVDGSEAEHAIETANFYFYSANGTYVTEGTVAKANLGSVTESGTYIEYRTKTVIVLENLTQKGTPKYVLAVLNKPTGLSLTNLSIAEAQKVILDGATGSELSGEGYYKNGNNFIMTNSTYNGTTEVDQIAYFATAIDADQFLEQPVSNEELESLTNPVEIYVERLAAKVGLSISNEIATDKVKEIEVEADTELGITAGKYKAYKLNTVNVSDMVTAENATKAELTAQQPELYAMVYGWDLNATNKKSYLMKNVPAWGDATTTALGFAWDESNYKRANWCHSWNYNDANEACTYPDNYLDTSNSTAINDGKDGDNAANYTLNYVNWKSLSNEVDKDDYCAENTNTADKLNAADVNFHAAVTEVLVKARIVDANGDPVNLFRYDNVLYKEAAYLERLFAKVQPQICYKSGTETLADGTTKDIYTYISSEDVEHEYVNEGDGKVSVKFTVKTTEETDANGNATSKPAQTWGTISVGSDGNETFTAFADDEEGTTDAQTAEEKINAALKTAFETLFAAERNPDDLSRVLADHYKDGMMYYNIPIEHLRVQTDGGSDTTTGNPYNEDGVIDVLEAEYGVVRNHWYKISINSISNLGSAVHDANEDIIPDETKNVLYSIAARINVLSWKVVNQGVDL